MISALYGGNVVDEREQILFVVLSVAERELYLDFAERRAFELNILYGGVIQRGLIERNPVLVHIPNEVDESAVVLEGYGLARG